MNRRLKKGEILGKLLASTMASLMLVPSLPVAASDAGNVQGSDTTVKTLSPLTETEVAQAEPQAALKPALQFTPSGDADSSASNTPAIVRPGDASTLPNLDEALAAPSPKVAPAAASKAEPKSDDEAPSATPATTDDAKAVAPAEVTDPEPLKTSDKDDSEKSADGKEIAQSPNSPRSITDPVYRKMPHITGSVKIRRGFDKFATNSIIHNLSFRDTPVKEVVAEIGRRGNLNIIIDKSVVGRITGDLHDITLNEAMDTVLASAGLQWRQLDNSTVVVASPNAFVNLGLNRPTMRAFKLNYASPFDVAQLLWASVFNRGYAPDFTNAVRNRSVNLSRETPVTKGAEEVTRISQAPAPGGGTQTSKSSNINTMAQDQNEENETGQETNQTTRPDTQRVVRGSQREQTNEGTGFNSAAIDPGSQTIRARATVVTDYTVDQNGGGTIVIPDQRNNQVLVVGTEDDLNVAEEAIRLIDRRPKQIHIQCSLIELTNQGIRQLGASLNLQGEGASGSVLGGSGAPMISFLPGLGSVQQFMTTILGGTQVRSDRVSGIPPVPVQFSGTTAQGFLSTSYGSPGAATVSPGTSGSLGTATNNLTDVPAPANGFAGILGTALPLNTPSIAGITATPQSQTGFNFLTLGRRAGGRANIATLPTGLNLSVNMVLQTNKAKVLANPSVIVNDQTESLITLANEVVHKVTTTISLGVVSTNVELVKAGVFLNVLPKATEDGFVTMRIRPQVSSPLGGPQIFANGNVVVTLLNVREIIAQEIRVKDGQTLVLGGLFSEQEASTLAKVPYLAEAPILGAIFRNSIKGRNRTELMLMITPKIVEDAPTAPTIGDGGSTGPTM
jgi:type II secretory pathway component GspD/PulD (secretin)